LAYISAAESRPYWCIFNHFYVIRPTEFGEITRWLWLLRRCRSYHLSYATSLVSKAPILHRFRFQDIVFDRSKIAISCV